MTDRQAVLAELAAHGILLKQDPKLPSVVGLVTGESLRTSWWSHPKSHAIFDLLQELVEHPDVLLTKLVSGKDTFVHRRLWPELLAVGLERGTWQTRGLSPESRALLRKVNASRNPVEATGQAGKEILLRLLATAQDVHTDSGKHALALRSWKSWASQARCAPAASATDARERLEEAVLALGGRLEGLPWRAK